MEQAELTTMPEAWESQVSCWNVDTGSRWCEDLVAEDVHDVKNILRHLRILRGKSHIHGKPPIEVSPVIYEDAPDIRLLVSGETAR